MLDKIPERRKRLEVLEIWFCCGALGLSWREESVNVLSKTEKQGNTYYRKKADSILGHVIRKESLEQGTVKERV